MQLTDYRHTLEIPVRFMDIDALGHVNNARYLNFLEEARLDYSRKLLDTYHNINDLNIFFGNI